MRWGDGVPSDWKDQLGQLNGDEAPFATQRLNRVVMPVLGSTNLRLIESSGMVPGNDVGGRILDSILNLVPDPNENCNIEMLKITTNNIRVVRHLSLHYFKSKLIEHFDILWKQNKIFGHNHAVM